MFAIKYLLFCCVMATVFAQDDDTESTSPVIWVLFSLLFLIVGAMVIGMLFIVYHFHQRFKKIEIRFSRRASISSDRYYKNSDSRRSSKRSITSNGRYENNPIRKRHSQSPRSSPQSDPAQQQNHNNDHVVVPMDAIYRNLQEPQQQQISIDNNLGHYETLAMYANNDSVTENEVSQEEEQNYQQQQHGAKQPTVDNQQKHKPDSNDDGNEDVPVIEASYITTPFTDRTVTRTASDGDRHGLEYSDVANPSPPRPSKTEHKKVNSVRKGKRPESSEEYTDPMHNGVANMKRLKASSVNSKTPDTTSAEADSKQRHASESVVGASHRKDFEEWPIKPTSPNAAPAHESDL